MLIILLIKIKTQRKKGKMRKQGKHSKKRRKAFSRDAFGASARHLKKRIVIIYLKLVTDSPAYKESWRGYKQIYVDCTCKVGKEGYTYAGCAIKNGP